MLLHSGRKTRATEFFDFLRETGFFFAGLSVSVAFDVYKTGLSGEPLPHSVGVAASAALFYVILYVVVRNIVKQPLGRMSQSIGNFAFGFLMGGVLAFFVILSASGINQILYKLPGKYLNWLAIAVLPVGYSAHRFKRIDQRWYGIAEVLAGMATALSVTIRPINPQPTAQGFALIAAMYVVARGFNNIYEANDKQAIAFDDYLRALRNR